MIDDTIKKIIEDKDVALVGNALSIFNEPRPIDKHEVVIRINKGFPKLLGSEYIGERTDILATSLAIEEKVIKYQYNPKAILWCTPKHELMNDYLRRVAIKYPLQGWQVLVDGLQARPSTGFMTFCYIFASCKTITLYGFDFWASDNWYTKNKHIGPHSPTKEKEVIEAMIKSKGRIVI